MSVKADGVKVLDRGYLGASFEGERREIAWASPRLELQAAGENGVYDFSGSYRAPRFIVSVRTLSNSMLSRSSFSSRAASAGRLSKPRATRR